MKTVCKYVTLINYCISLKIILKIQCFIIDLTHNNCNVFVNLKLLFRKLMSEHPITLEDELFVTSELLRIDGSKSFVYCLIVEPVRVV
jgi:hypothetical protein